MDSMLIVFCELGVLHLIHVCGILGVLATTSIMDLYRDRELALCIFLCVYDT